MDVHEIAHALHLASEEVRQKLYDALIWCPLPENVVRRGLHNQVLGVLAAVAELAWSRKKTRSGLTENGRCRLAGFLLAALALLVEL
jgi:hypothetical protein